MLSSEQLASSSTEDLRAAIIRLMFGEETAEVAGAAELSADLTGVEAERDGPSVSAPEGDVFLELKSVSAREMAAKTPERMIEAAIRGMLPKTKLGRKQFKKLKVYRGSRHPHEAQRPRQMPLPAARRGAA